MHEDQSLLVSFEGPLDEHKIIVQKVIEDCLWLAPKWFSNHLKSYDTSKIIEFRELADRVTMANPTILTAYAARNLKDKEMYPRALGMIAAHCYGYLHPIGCAMIMHSIQDDRVVDIIKRFDKEVAENVRVIPTQRVNFDNYSIQQLEASSIASQEYCTQIGQRLYEIYSAGTSFFEEPKLVVEFYGNLVNLVLYCWLMTTNQELLSYSSGILENKPDFRKNFNIPLHHKGKKLWDSMRDKLPFLKSK